MLKKLLEMIKPHIQGNVEILNLKFIFDYIDLNQAKSISRNTKMHDITSIYSQIYTLMQWDIKAKKRI